MEAQLRAGVYGRLSETYDAALPVPTRLERGTAVRCGCVFAGGGYGVNARIDGNDAVTFRAYTLTSLLPTYTVPPATAGLESTWPPVV